MPNTCRNRLSAFQARRAARLHEQDHIANMARLERVQTIIIFFKLVLISEEFNPPNQEVNWENIRFSIFSLRKAKQRGLTSNDPRSTRLHRTNDRLEETTKGIAITTNCRSAAQSTPADNGSTRFQKFGAKTKKTPPKATPVQQEKILMARHLKERMRLSATRQYPPTKPTYSRRGVPQTHPDSLPDCLFFDNVDIGERKTKKRERYLS